jgi:hypothetical protein
MYCGADDIFPSENAGRVMDKNKDNKDNSHGTGVASNPKPDIRGRLRGHFRFIGDYSLQYRCSPRLRANAKDAENLQRRMVANVRTVLLFPQPEARA